MRKFVCFATTVLMLGLGACASRTDNTIGGAAAGGLAGAVVAGPVGAAVGAVAGGVVGHNVRPKRRLVKRRILR